MSETKPMTGEKIGEVEFVTRYSESSVNHVKAMVDVGSLDVDYGDEVVLQFYKRDNTGNWEILNSYAANVYNSDKRVTLKQSVVTTHDIKPGTAMKVEVYERPETEVETDSGAVLIDRVSPSSDVTSSDNLDARLRSKDVSEYLDGSPMELKFRNAKNGNTARAIVSPVTSGYAFQFPKQVRDSLDAEVDDLIEVIDPGDTHSLDGGEEDEVEERIREMHSMMMDLYNDYLEQKND